MAKNYPVKQSVSLSCAPLCIFLQYFIMKNFKHSAKLETSYNDYPLDSNINHLLFLLFHIFIHQFIFFVVGCKNRTKKGNTDPVCLC